MAHKFYESPHVSCPCVLPPRAAEQSIIQVAVPLAGWAGCSKQGWLFLVALY